MTEVVVGRRERKKEETKRRIFLAAVELFTEKGFDSTTVDEISERADVAKGTFFNYFPRKEALLEYVGEEWLEVAESVAGDRGRPASLRLEDMLASAAATFGENRELLRMVARFSMEQLCVPQPERVGVPRRADQLIDDVFREGQVNGEFRPDLEPYHARLALGSVFIGTVMWWIGTRDGRVDPQARGMKLADAIRFQCGMVMDGLRPREDGQ